MLFIEIIANFFCHELIPSSIDTEISKFALIAPSSGELCGQ